ncbi:MAG: flagellar brake protein, partial [Actinobacteria bacterium]|nr:flagellar brake protein [Actinomycetota bacterium]
MLSVSQNILVSKKNEIRWHSSVIMDVDDSEVIISYPKLNGLPINIAENDMLEITLSRNGVRYRFETVFSQMIGDVLVVKKPRLLEKVDLRRYPRIPVKMDVFFSEISCKNVSGPDTRKGKIMDISGNGLRFSVDQLYIPSTYMSVKFDIPLKEKVIPINMECRVVRIIVDDRKDPVEYQLGAEFSRIEKKDQELIVDFVSS